MQVTAAMMWKPNTTSTTPVKSKSNHASRDDDDENNEDGGGVGGGCEEEDRDQQQHHHRHHHHDDDDNNSNDDEHDEHHPSSVFITTTTTTTQQKQQKQNQKQQYQRRRASSRTVTTTSTAAPAPAAAGSSGQQLHQQQRQRLEESWGSSGSASSAYSSSAGSSAAGSNTTGSGSDSDSSSGTGSGTGPRSKSGGRKHQHRRSYSSSSSNSNNRRRSSGRRLLSSSASGSASGTGTGTSSNRLLRRPSSSLRHQQHQHNLQHASFAASLLVVLPQKIIRLTRRILPTRRLSCPQCVFLLMIVWSVHQILMTEDLFSMDGSNSRSILSSIENDQHGWLPSFSTTTNASSSSSSSSSLVQESNSVPLPKLTEQQKIHVVISHCDASIKWTWEQCLFPYKFDTMTVITKCGNPLDPEDNFPPKTKLLYEKKKQKYYKTPSNQIIQVLDLPNVGRCDHSYLYWIQQFMTIVQRQKPHSDSSSSSSSRQYPSIDFTGYNFDVDNDLVLFMKDNDNSYRGDWEDEVPFPTMLSNVLPGPGCDSGDDCESTSSSTGFVCAGEISTTPKVYDPSMERSSNMAGRVELGLFQMDEYAGARESDKVNNDIFQSLHRPMYKWIEHLSSPGGGSNTSDDSTDNSRSDGRRAAEQSLVDELATSRRPSMNFSLSPLDENQNQIIPVCFGGRFMTTLNQIINNGNVDDWTPILESLSRGDNIEEGHYMERMWAALLSKPIPLHEQHEFLRRKVRHFTKHTIIGLISVLPDGAPPFPSIIVKEHCINCRYHVPLVDQDKLFVDSSYFSEIEQSNRKPADDGIDECRMIDHGNTTSHETMTALDRCYAIMELRGCRKNDKFERRFRLQADQCRRAKKIMLRQQERDRMNKEKLDRNQQQDQPGQTATRSRTNKSNKRDDDLMTKK